MSSEDGKNVNVMKMYIIWSSKKCGITFLKCKYCRIFACAWARFLIILTFPNILKRLWMSLNISKRLQTSSNDPEHLPTDWRLLKTSKVSECLRMSLNISERLLTSLNVSQLIENYSKTSWKWTQCFTGHFFLVQELYLTKKNLDLWV